jgi:effector-binding domain-containing protein
VLEARRLELERQLALDQHRLADLAARLREIQAPAPVALPEVVVTELPAVRVASRRARVAHLDDGIEELFETLEREVAAADVRASGPPLVLYHDRDHRESDATVEVAVPVLTDAASIGRVRVRTLPKVPAAACVVYAGGYEQWTDLTRALLGWLQARRLAPAGPMREVFLQFGVRAKDELRVPHAYLAERPADYVTEMQIPVRGRDMMRRSTIGGSRGSRRRGRS